MPIAMVPEQAVTELSSVCLRPGTYCPIVDCMNQIGSPSPAGGNQRGVGGVHPNTNPEPSLNGEESCARLCRRT